eukprot:m51a1_g1705 hypothetical protein (223) ;mRNA; f:518204-518872
MDAAFNKKLQREAEKEKELYGEVTEKFVTASYREQLEKDRRWEEKQDEADAVQSKRPIDLVSFHRNLLEDRAAAGRGEPAPEPAPARGSGRASHGGHDELKHALLSELDSELGKTTERRPNTSSLLEAERERQRAEREEEERLRREEHERREQKKRQTEEQYAEVQRKRKAAEEVSAEELASRLAKRSTQETISDARRRYLERKEQLRKDLEAAKIEAAKDS